MFLMNDAVNTTGSFPRILGGSTSNMFGRSSEIRFRIVVLPGLKFNFGQTTHKCSTQSINERLDVHSLWLPGISRVELEGGQGDLPSRLAASWNKAIKRVALSCPRRQRGIRGNLAQRAARTATIPKPRTAAKLSQ